MLRGKRYSQGIPARPGNPAMRRTFHGHDYLGRTPSEREQELLAYIMRFASEHLGHTPTLRQMCQACRISSTSVASYTVRNLVRLGKLEYVNDLLVIKGSQFVLPQDAEKEREQ